MSTTLSQVKDIIHDGRKRIAIAMREPWGIEEETITIPSPGQMPQAPPALNLLMMILPPIIMLGGTLIVSLVSQNVSIALIAPMLIMSMGFPLANLIGHWSAKKKYNQVLLLREQGYRKKLEQVKQEIEKSISLQRQKLETEFPCLKEIVTIAESRGSCSSLWCRRPSDNDFLSLRLGEGQRKPELKFVKPQNFDLNDTLVRLSDQLIEDYQYANHMPLAMSLKTIGSLVVTGKSNVAIAGLARRLILELLAFHSPDGACLGVICDRVDAADRWGWLKWAPHTNSLSGSPEKAGLAFSKDEIEGYLTYIKRVYQARKEKSQAYNAQNELPIPVHIIVLDDNGSVRQSELVGNLAKDGYIHGIYLIVLGERGAPNNSRSRVAINDRHEFTYLETWDRDGKTVTLTGKTETAGIDSCEQVSRALAGLEIAGGQAASSLPQMVRISTLLGDDPFSLEILQNNWRDVHRDEAQLLFPAGVVVSQNGVEEFDIDFRPEKYGGKGEYHAMLIGTTGSGKSIFLQSLVLATAHRYSPREINFLFMDFKAGAAELKKISKLPHVVGMITDLGPALAERALKALENELERRKSVFDEAGNITDIWDFNNRFPARRLPHLLVVIDEFAEGIKILPSLVERLSDLGRQGRAFGMYFLLANQEVNFSVESLKSNVGWSIVLKVKRVEEMSLVDRSLPNPPGKGRGYIRVKSDICEFQGAYAGSPVITSSEDAIEFVIEKVEANGTKSILYKHSPGQQITGGIEEEKVSELELLLTRMNEAAERMNIEPARPIYLEPLPSPIPLGEMLNRQTTYRRFDGKAWTEIFDPAKKFTVPVGMIDIPEDCLQKSLVLDFTQDDGNLWIIGSPGSGKGNTVVSILQALAFTHRPDEVQFYCLEYGTGSLRALEALPHVGAVIRLPESERLQRLIRFLDAVIDRRTALDDWRMTGEPELFLVINNYAELRTSYPDQAESIARYVTRGKSAGLHLIITTARGSDLHRSVSSNIARRIALQMATNDEYLDVIGKPPAPLSAKAEGRGYYMSGKVSECQLCSPDMDPGKGLQLGDLFLGMDSVWEGPRPSPILTLPKSISYNELITSYPICFRPEIPVQAIVGIAYDDLQVITVNLEEEMPNWLVLGPGKSGKTNFLMSMAYSVYQNNQDACEIKAFALRRGPFSRMASDNDLGRSVNIPIQIFTTADQIVAECQELSRRAPTGNPKKVLLLIDDLGGAFEPGKEAVSMALNQLAGQLSSFTDVFLIASCMRDEVQMQLGQPIIRVLRQGKNGISFSLDNNDLDWLGGFVSLALKKIPFPLGRGLYVSRGSVRVVQTPCVDHIQR